MRVREKKHRLPEAAYYGQKSVAFTACTENRRRGLANASVVEALLPMLESAANTHGCLVPLYCFMPDHLHLVIRGMTDTSAPKRAAEAFKRDSGMWLAENRPNLEWQKDFYDRILRYNEISATVRYLALNPVRAGLTSDINAWPFTGSLGYNLSEVLQDAFWE